MNLIDILIDKKYYWEFATLLSGRYISFEISTLSFNEFINFRKENNFTDKDLLNKYIQIGGFPLFSTIEYDDEQVEILLNDLHRSVVITDVVSQYKITNVSLLERIILFVYNNIGNIFSARKIADFLLSNNKEKTNVSKINEYLTYLENVFAIRKVKRYNIDGKKLETNCKYYLSDHSLQYAVGKFQKTKLPGILENIVFNELIRRGYKVFVEKLNERDNREIDFITEKSASNERIYIRVCKEFNSQ
ncbi:MAG: DUF4143 domain-containing protein [Mycoplasmataceae bacterium]|nr:DUF4143 domain-containing protein [Mycoplasmataceae bacterium]